MSAITPQTELRLLKCPLEEDNRHQLTFTNATSQYTYFNSLTHLTCDNFTYQRKDSIIRYPEHIDNLLTYNYVMYQNEAYSNKWFYAFITNMEYVNDHMTNITIKTDVFQTWQFNIIYKKSFIEREHTNDDSYYKNTLPENLEIGEYISYQSTNMNLGSANLVMASVTDPYDPDTSQGGGIYGGIYSGVKYYLFKNESALNNAIQQMSTRQDDIQAIFYLPNFITGYSTATWNAHDYTEIPNTSSTSTQSGSSIPLRPSAVGSYTPKNNKLFSFPYMYYLISNNQGSSLPYYLEDFEDNNTHTGDFTIKGACCVGGSIRLVPDNYKRNTAGFSQFENEYGINLGKYPICNYKTDVYKNWSAQNSLNNGINTYGGGAGIVAGTALALSGNVPLGLGLITTGVGAITSTLKQHYQRSLNPMEANGNINSGDVTYSMGRNTFTLYWRVIKPEYAKIIDDYFSTYGYKTNKIKLPNITGRTNWNYVKTIDCNLEGDIPENDINELKTIFNKGITFWHNPSNFLNYDSSNAIIQ